jgi:hypothetical protein
VDEIDKGHYVTTCLACEQIFRPEKITTIEKHIVSSCLKVDCSIREAVIYMVEAREREVSSGTNVKCQNNEDQTILKNFTKIQI